MKTSTFTTATISTGTYNTKDYSCKEYSTLAGFKRGLKANNCPFILDENNTFDGLLKRQWGKLTATIY